MTVAPNLGCSKPTTTFLRVGGINAAVVCQAADMIQVVSVGQDRSLTFWDLREPQPLQVTDRVFPTHSCMERLSAWNDCPPCFHHAVLSFPKKGPPRLITFRAYLRASTIRPRRWCPARMARSAPVRRCRRRACSPRAPRRGLRARDTVCERVRHLTCTPRRLTSSTDRTLTTYLAVSTPPKPKLGAWLCLLHPSQSWWPVSKQTRANDTTQSVKSSQFVGQVTACVERHVHRARINASIRYDTLSHHWPTLVCTTSAYFSLHIIGLL